MKIALCLSGHLRNFERTFPTLYFYFTKDYDVDIFIHTWDKLGFSCPYKTDRTLNETNSKLNEINKLYAPKNMIIENSSFIEELKRQGDEYAPHLMREPKHVGHMASMFYKIYAANELKNKYQLDTGIQYDWVVRCRADLLFHQKVSIPLYPENNKIWLPRFLCRDDWYTDQLAIGSSNDMDLYSSAFFDIPEYFKARREFRPEKFLIYSMKKKHLSANWTETRFEILR